MRVLWNTVIYMCDLMCSRLYTNQTARRPAASETAVLEIVGALSERRSAIREEEEEDTGETTPWTAWTL